MREPVTASETDRCPACGVVLGHLRGGCDACGAWFLRSAELRGDPFRPFFFGMKIRLDRHTKKRMTRGRKAARKRTIREAGRHDRWWLLGKYGTTDGVEIFSQDLAEAYDDPFKIAVRIPLVEAPHDHL